MDFPQYRKRFDQKSFYKIVNKQYFEEVQLIGKKVFIHQIEAKKYFELLRIEEMIASEGALYKSCTKEEYENVRRVHP